MEHHLFNVDTSEQPSPKFDRVYWVRGEAHSIETPGTSNLNFFSSSWFRSGHTFVLFRHFERRFEISLSSPSLTSPLALNLPKI